jgi:O-antigen ligase
MIREAPIESKPRETGQRYGKVAHGGFRPPCGAYSAAWGVTPGSTRAAPPGLLVFRQLFYHQPRSGRPSIRGNAPGGRFRGSVDDFAVTRGAAPLDVSGGGAYANSIDASQQNLRARALVLLATVLAAAMVRSLFISPALLRWQIAALVGGLALGVWRLRDGMVALVFLTPLLGVIPRSLGINDLSLPEHLLLPLLLCGTLRMAWTSAPRPVSAIDRPLALYMGVVTLSAARALWEYLALGLSPWAVVGPQLDAHFAFTIWDFTKGPFLVVHYTVVAIEGALWFIVLTAPSTAVRAAPLRAALVLSAAAVALVGAAQAHWHFQLIRFFAQVQPGLLRVNSTLPDPNTLGSFLVLLFPLGLVVALERPAGRWCAAAWSGVVLYCLIRCVSRTAWVSLAVVACGATAVAGWRPAALGMQLSAAATRHLRLAFAAMLVSAALAVVAVTVGGIGRDLAYRDARSPADMLLFTLNAHRSVDEVVPARADRWHAAIDIWQDFPLLGAGIGKYALLKNRYRPEARFRWMFFTEPHNYYLKVLAELGIVGLAAFVVLLASIAVQARRAGAASAGGRRRRVAAVVAGIAGFLLCSLGQDPLVLREMQYVFWAVVALLVLEVQEAAASAPIS